MIGYRFAVSSLLKMWEKLTQAWKELSKLKEDLEFATWVDGETSDYEEEVSNGWVVATGRLMTNRNNNIHRQTNTVSQKNKNSKL